MKNSLLLILGILFVLVILCFIIGIQKENKEEIAKYYNITKPTLNKWVKYFPCAITFNAWITKRKITVFDSTCIKHKWGNDTSMVLNKSQIAELGSASNKAVTKCVMENLEKIGLTKEAWKKCSVFPPVICQRIIDLLIGKPVPTVEEQFASLFTNPQTI